MAGIDADLMREARELFARFQKADPANARRKWQSISVHAPKASPWKPKGSTNSDLDQVLLQLYDDWIADDPLIQPEAVSRIADAVAAAGPKIFGRHYTFAAIEMRLRRLLVKRGGVKRFTVKERIKMKQDRDRVQLAKALMNPPH
jgi:hypothetical protein